MNISRHTGASITCALHNRSLGQGFCASEMSSNRTPEKGALAATGSALDGSKSATAQIYLQPKAIHKPCQCWDVIGFTGVQLSATKLRARLLIALGLLNSVCSTTDAHRL